MTDEEKKNVVGALSRARACIAQAETALSDARHEIRCFEGPGWSELYDSLGEASFDASRLARRLVDLREPSAIWKDD